MNQSNVLKLKMEKNLAVIEFNQVGCPILSQDIREQLRSYIEKIIKSSSIYVAILDFQNTKIKSINIKEIEKIHGKEKWERLLDEVHELFHLIENANVSWIAATHGACLSSQLELTLTCDYRIADFNKNTVFGFPELTVGLIPNFGGCIRLPRLIGVKKSLEMILKIRPVSSHEAYKLGLVQKVVHPLDLKNQARILSEKIIKGHIPPKPLQKYKPLNFLDKFFEIPLNRQILFYRTKKQILSETKGFYPAPLKALEVIKKTYPVKSLKTALKEESNAFCDLIVSPITKHLMTLHSSKEKITSFPQDSSFPRKRELNQTTSSSDSATILSTSSKIAVMGAGTMGGGITYWLANHHIPVLLKDIHAPSLSSSLRMIHSLWDEQLNKLNIFRKKNRTQFSHLTHTQISWDKQIKSKKARASKIRPQMDYSGFPSVDLAIETVVEDLEIKKKVIAEAASQLSDRCLFATNTSSFSVTELAKAHPDPTRFLGLHFFYPVYQTPLVEVVRAEQSSDNTIISVSQWIKALGKTPFIVKDKPGFLVHRLFLPLISEALWLLHEGVAIQQIDQIYSSFGFSMGPFRLMDELGLDICMKLIKSLKSTDLDLNFPTDISNLRPIFLGKKNKSGFYIYNNKLQVESVNSLIYQDLKLKPNPKNIPETDCLERGLYRMINEAACTLEEQVVTKASELDLALILGIGFPAFRGGLLKYADEISLKTIIAGLNNFSKRWGKRFHPSSALLKQEETGFYKNLP